MAPQLGGLVNGPQHIAPLRRQFDRPRPTPTAVIAPAISSFPSRRELGRDCLVPTSRNADPRARGRG